MNVIDEDVSALTQRGRVPLLRPDGGEQVRLFAPFPHPRDPEVIFDHLHASCSRHRSAARSFHGYEPSAANPSVAALTSVTVRMVNECWSAASPGCHDVHASRFQH